eukprot:gene7114-2666_t
MEHQLENDDTICKPPQYLKFKQMDALSSEFTEMSIGDEHDLFADDGTDSSAD